MRVTRFITDSWMEQREVQARIKDTANWEDEWISVYEDAIRNVEHFLGFLLPVSSQRAAKTLKDLSGIATFIIPVVKLQKVRLKHTHYLGLRSDRFLELEFERMVTFQTAISSPGGGSRIAQIQKADTIICQARSSLKLCSRHK